MIWNETAGFWVSNLNNIEKVNALFLCMPIPPQNFRFPHFEKSTSIYQLFAVCHCLSKVLRVQKKTILSHRGLTKLNMTYYCTRTRAKSLKRASKNVKLHPEIFFFFCEACVKKTVGFRSCQSFYPLLLCCWPLSFGEPFLSCPAGFRTVNQGISP